MERRTPMNHNTTRTLGLSLGFFLLFILVPLHTATSPNIMGQPQELSSHQPTDMLILLSPQYAHDQDIHQAITTYITAVYNDISWTIHLVRLTTDQNTYQHIDTIIEQSYATNPLKAVLVIGEDTDTAYAGGHDHLNKPSTVPWYTIGGNESYEFHDGKIVAQPYTMDICVSLLYPTSTLAYETKKHQIISALTKFATQRTHVYTNHITVLQSSELAITSQPLYKNLEQYATISYNTDPSPEQLTDALHTPTSLFFVHGHSTPSGTQLATEKTWFTASTVDQLQTPFFGADGCYVNGWWSEHNDSSQLSPSAHAAWYGSKIFSSTHIKVMVLGLLSQHGYDYPVSFLEHAIPKLVQGYTLAESLIGQSYIGDNPIVFGDPTFHFTM